MRTGLNFDIQEDAVGECYSGHDDDIGKVQLFCIKNLFIKCCCVQMALLIHL